MNEAAKEAVEAAKGTASARAREGVRALENERKCPMRRRVRQGFRPGPERGLPCPPRGRFEIS